MHPAGFYEVNGRKIFEIRGASGGVATSQIFYVVGFVQHLQLEPCGFELYEQPRRSGWVLMDERGRVSEDLSPFYMLDSLQLIAINRALENRWGGRPLFRVVYSETEFEVRYRKFSVFDNSGNYLGEHEETGTFRKYQTVGTATFWKRMSRTKVRHQR